MLPNLEDLEGSNMHRSDIYASPSNLEGSASPFEMTAKHRKQRGVLGNSASGLILHPKGGKRQEMPKSVFSSVVSLPKLKEYQSHRTFKKMCDDRKPNSNFELPPYRGYHYDPSSKKDIKRRREELKVRERELAERLDSRYRLQNPLRSTPHVTWRLLNYLKKENDKKTQFPDPENPGVELSEKTEVEYLKKTLDVSIDELQPFDSERKELIGRIALKDFNTHYKLLPKIESENGMKKNKASVYTSVLSHESRKNLLPLKMNVVKSVGDPYTIDNS